MADHQPADPSRLAPEGEAERRQLPPRRGSRSATPGEGQVLVRHHFLSLDPYMRGRMNDAKSYAQPQPLDEVMQGGTVGEVVESKHPELPAAATRSSAWAAGRSTRGRCRRAGRAAQGRHHARAALGLPRRGRHAGRHRLVRPDEDLRAEGRARRSSSAPPAARSAASSASSPRRAAAARSASPAAPTSARYVDRRARLRRLHRLQGARRPKSLYAGAEGSDARTASTATSRTSAARSSTRCCARMNAFGRIALCGMISGYDGQPIPLQQPQLILQSRLTLEGFIVSEHMEVWPRR